MIHLYEVILGEILQVPVKGINYVLKASPTLEFIAAIEKMRKLSKTRVSKKFIKGAF